MCSGVQQLVSIIKTYNLPCHLQGQTHRAWASLLVEKGGLHPLQEIGAGGPTVQLQPI